MNVVNWINSIDERFGAIMLGWITGSLLAAITFRFSISLLISLIFSVVLIVIRLNYINVKYNMRREILERRRQR